MFRIYDVKCNDLTNPVGIIEQDIYFSWKLSSDKNNTRQTVYQIKVYDEDGLCVWDSGEVSSAETQKILYKGDSLKSGCTYKAAIKSVNNHCEEVFASNCSFTTGLLDRTDFKGKWIWDGRDRKPGNETTEMWKVFAGMIPKNEHPEEILDAPVSFVREISIEKSVKKAIAYITAKGVYELSIDGKTVSEFLAPGYTEYNSAIALQTIDLTEYLTPGNHSVVITLADGWYTGKIGLVGIGYQYGTHNALAYDFRITYDDGTTDEFCSDEGCTWQESDFKYADLFIGECYAERAVGFDGPPFTHSVSAEELDGSVLCGRTIEPVSVVKEIMPDIITSPSGELIINLGENIAGYIDLKFNAEKGTEVKMSHSEVLDKDGNFLANIVGQNKNQTDIYICNNDGEHYYKPHFTFHGFQYVKVEGLNKDQILGCKGYFISSVPEKASSFTCSHEGINKLQDNILRSQRANMLWIPTDCPQRERAGWTGDMQVFSDTACFNADVKAFLRNWLSYMRVQQLSDGQIPNVIPDIDSNKYVNNSQSEHVSSTGWADACIIVPFVLYRKYGDISFLEDNYEMMNRWMDYCCSMASKTEPRHLWNTDFHFGDWLFPSASKKGMFNPVETAELTKEYVAPLFMAYSSLLMVQISEILNHSEKACCYRNLYESIKTEFIDCYYDDNLRLPVELQGLYVLALKTDVIPYGKKETVVKHLADLITENDGCLDTGFLSVPFLLDVLYENGEAELAYSLLYQNKCPSWLYEVEKGANTIWESWSAIAPDGTMSSASYNHFAFGCVGDFIYRRILGIKELEPGYKKVLIAPDVMCGLDFAEGYYECPYGKIVVSWRKENERLTIEGELPPNVTGVLRINGAEYNLGPGRFMR